MPELTIDLIETYLDRTISEICRNGMVADDSNHCAHFVNHVLALDFGLSCADMTGGTQSPSNIRVHETFARCPTVGLWPPAPLHGCFAFITKRSAVKLATKTMTNIPKKHIGIFCDGSVWHYSNTRDKVVRQAPADFARHFSGPGFAMFFGTFPPGAQPRPWT